MSSRVVAAARLGRLTSQPLPWGTLLVPALLLLGLFFAYPLVYIGERSFTEFQLPGETGWDNYRWFFESSANLTILIRTLVTATAVTVGSLALGYPFAYLMTIVSKPWRLLMIAVVLTPFLTSTMVRTYAWVVLLQDNGLVNDALGTVGLGPTELIGSARAVAIGMLENHLPVMILPLYAAMSRIDRSLVLAAESLGASPVQAFRRVYLPLSYPGIVAGSLLVFVMTLGNYITPALLGSPQQSLLPQVIVTQVNQLIAFGRAGAVGLILLGLVLLLLAFAGRTGRRVAGLSVHRIEGDLK